ncbi:hypothetical protein GCM10010492_01910 [Saccharothrix mutabilis subsp. mutabilis]|uniref:Uncharacterized protein n=1 Tax=Saccharothrix mutabilis subsp. mutabilis TaxID=66855 RepID=A0ABN0SZZ4_9PSEU
MARRAGGGEAAGERRRVGKRERLRVGGWKRRRVGEWVRRWGEAAGGLRGWSGRPWVDEVREGGWPGGVAAGGRWSDDLRGG